MIIKYDDKHIEVDISLFDEMDDSEAYDYLRGKYSEVLANEVRALFEKSMENEK